MTRLRVAQWTTGNVAAEAVKAILRRDDLELVGAYAYSPEKNGVDVGTLCGLGRELGVRATTDVDALLALDLDCVVHMPLHRDTAELERLLRAGVNVVTSAEFLTGRSLPDGERTRLESAARDGGATLFGSGLNPGYMQMVAAVASGMTTNVQRVTMTESVDVGQFIGDANFAAVGWGRPPGDPGHAAAVEAGTVVFAEGVDALARIMGVDLDDIECDVEFAHATEDVVADGVTIRAGHVGGMDVGWHGVKAGVRVLSLNQRWVATPHLEPAWKVEHCYLIDVVGDPHINMRVGMFPTEADLADLTRDRMRGIGLRATAAPLVNAIPAVCAAAPRIATYADLPLITGPLQVR